MPEGWFGLQLWTRVSQSRGSSLLIDEVGRVGLSEKGLAPVAFVEKTYLDNISIYLPVYHACQRHQA